MGKRKSLKRPGYKPIRVRLFWSLISIGFAFAAILLLWPFGSNKTQESAIIRAGITGQVAVPAVYSLPEGSDLSMLIRLSKGLKPNADIRETDLSQLIKNDSVYFIPAREAVHSSDTGIFKDKEQNEFIISHITDSLPLPYKEKKIREFNVLYVGLPSLFVIINYFPELNQVNLVHIPYSCVFKGSQLRIIDSFLTLGTGPTMRLIENNLGIKLENYIIQDKFGFIDMVNLLGGVELNLDKSFADYYKLQPGLKKLNGTMAWEYIRFIDLRNIEIDFDQLKSGMINNEIRMVNPSQWQQAYELRHQRQRYVLEAMRKSFNNLNPLLQFTRLSKIVGTFETDLTAEKVTGIYDEKGLSIPAYRYGSIPGYYSTSGGNLLFYPDVPSFASLRNKLIRDYLVKEPDKPLKVY